MKKAILYHVGGLLCPFCGIFIGWALVAFTEFLIQAPPDEKIIGVRAAVCVVLGMIGVIVGGIVIGTYYDNRGKEES